MFCEYKLNKKVFDPVVNEWHNAKELDFITREQGQIHGEAYGKVKKRNFIFIFAQPQLTITSAPP